MRVRGVLGSAYLLLTSAVCTALGLSVISWDFQAEVFFPFYLAGYLLMCYGTARLGCWPEARVNRYVLYSGLITIGYLLLATTVTERGWFYLTIAAIFSMFGVILLRDSLP